MKKLIIITAAITVCLTLCAAVWPQAETVGETPALSQTPAVSAPEPIVAEAKLETEIDLPPEKENAVTPQPEPAPVEASAAPNADQCLNRSMLRNPLPYPPRRRRSLTCSPAIWFMWRASVGWNTKGQITANTARIFTKTATKSASWVDLKNCAA